jgi:deoxyribonuclease-4
LRNARKVINMIVKIGLPVWIGGLINIDLTNLLQLFKKYSVELVEISIDYPWPFKEWKLLEELINELVNNNIHIGIHAPWRDIVLATPYNILGEAVEKLLVEILDKILKLIPYKTYIVLHPLTMQKIELFNNRRDIIESLEERLSSLSKALGDRATLLLENLTRGFASEPSYLREVVKSINSEDIGICLDIGHLATRYMRELKSRYNDFYEYLEEVVEIINDVNVETIHIHDVDNKGSEHLLIGEGVLEFKKIFKIISPLKPSHIIYEMFRSKKTKPSLGEILRIINGQRTWVRIYIH